MKIGPFPILMHVISLYLKAGHSDFIICGGYKVDEIRKYFVNFSIHHSTSKINFSSGKISSLNESAPFDVLGDIKWDFNVVIVDTGLSTLTGGRLAQVRSFIRGDRFLCAYGDGVTNQDINEVVSFHIKEGKLGTLTAFHPPSRFGEVQISDSGIVSSFKEKPLSSSYVNAGFFVFETSVFDVLDPKTSLEDGLLTQLAASGQLAGFKSERFWQMMDTPREMQILNDLYESGNAPWLKS